MTDCKLEGAGARIFYGSLGRVQPRSISKGFNLEPLKVSAER